MQPLSLLLLLLSTLTLTAQTPAHQQAYGDTSNQQRPGYVQQLIQAGRLEATSSIKTYQLGKISLHQAAVLEELKRLTGEIRLFLKSGLAADDIRLMLAKTNAAITLAKDGIFTNKGSNQTQRNLEVSSTLLSELSERIGKQKAQLDSYSDQLVFFRVKTDSLQATRFCTVSHPTQ